MLGEEDTLGDSCLTLSFSIAQSPGMDPGEANYEAYADLEVPPLAPDEAMEHFELEDGFRIEVVAHEPMLTNPVAFDIDSDGRVWVVDMPSYMPVPDRSDWETAVREQVPQGRVIVLEDTNGDGQMDTHRVFREGLVLPRSIKVLADGVLVAEPPNVWLIRDTTGDGNGDTRELVFDRYGDPNVSNVEHLPNGLMWGMDNWLHSVHEGAVSLRRVDGAWRTRPFERLGQWGVTQDDWGRLFSAHNNRPLQAHLAPYGYSERHPYFEVSTGMNLSIAPSEPMWPAQAIGSNRSYQIGEEVREDDQTLRRATATLAPVVYRGDQFGEAYRGNAFTPEPAANLIKRFILENDPAEIDAEVEMAYEGREFLTSTDERFRPVNTLNAPDGSIYVLDMYHGLIQHARYLTDHLRNYAMERDLHRGNNEFGRIYRIVRGDREIDYSAPRFSELSASELVEYLRSENGQLRDQAQQVLAQCAPEGVLSELEAMAQDTSEEDYTRLQTLWSLEGMSRSAYGQAELTGLALSGVDDNHPRVRAAALRILEPALAEGDEQVLAQLKEFAESEPAPYVRLQLLASLGESSDESALPVMAELLDESADSPYFQEMALAGIYQHEDQFAAILQDGYGWAEGNGNNREMVLASLAEVEERGGEELAHLSEAERELFERGSSLYSTCAACHGSDGEGVSGLAPPLSGSDWAQSEPGTAARIVLHGFEGGTAERPRSAVNIAGEMPAHGFMSDDDLAAILTFIRQSWDNDASPIAPEEVARIRGEAGERQDLWTPDELRGLRD